MRARGRNVEDEIPCRPATFAVGTHSVVLSKGAGLNGRWSLAVDGRASGDMTFETEAEAWEAGVRVADRLDRDAAALPRP